MGANFIKIESIEKGYVLPDTKFYIMMQKESFEEDVLRKGFKGFLQKEIDTYQADFMLFFCEEQREYRFLFYSGSKQIRALEFMDFLIPEFGLSKGDAALAFGRISSAMLQLRMEESQQKDLGSFLCSRVKEYYEDVDWIDAVSYGELHQEEHKKLPLYQKKKVAWAYVESTLLADCGEEIFFSSLENESGVKLTVHPNRYVMIGRRGEIYDIAKEKFELTYEKTQEPLDVFASMMENLPEVKRLPSGDYLSLDEVAHICYPKAGFGIYAMELKRRTKVFYKDGNGEYFLGNTGDYLAIRPDDMTDIYIIRRDIFKQTYETGKLPG